jgi:uncharacterized protein (DUF1778 family)
MAQTLTPDQEFALISAGALLGWYAEALSDFEVETIAEVAERWLAQRCATVLTAAEWQVVDDAVAAMRAAAGSSYRRAA